MKSQTQVIGTCKILHLSKLTVSPYNARIQGQEAATSEHFQELCESIKSNGLIEPIVVRPIGDKFEVVAGTRRFAALKHIGMPSVSTVVKDMDDNDVRIASLVENVHRNGLTEDEKEESLKQIYLTTWDEWKPKDWALFDCSTDENKLKIAKSFLSRLNLEHRGIRSTEKSTNSTGKVGRPQKIFPTQEFKELKNRIGYVASTQYNILTGKGAFSSNTDFVEELPPTVKELLEEAAKRRKMQEAEKQQLAQKIERNRRTVKNKPRTQRAAAQQTIKKFEEELEEKREKEERKKQKEREQQDRQAQGIPRLPKQQKPKTQKSVVRSREDIVNAGMNLFRILTGQDLNTDDINIGEMQAKSLLATDTMQALATLYANSTERALQQHIIIPLNIAITKYRDLLYEAVENQKDKDEMLKP